MFTPASTLTPTKVTPFDVTLCDVTHASATVRRMSARLKAVPADGGSEAGGEVEGLTIEQLASETGFTVRNIRAHQARGLLPPPEVRARVGYYGDEHVARLQLIQELQADGFNLKGIKQL